MTRFQRRSEMLVEFGRIAAGGCAIVALIVGAARGQGDTPASAPSTSTEPQTAAGKKLLTLDAISFGPGRVNFDGRYESGFEWLDDGQHYLQWRDGVPRKIDAVSGKDVGPLYDVARMEEALRGVIGREPAKAGEKTKTEAEKRGNPPAAQPASSQPQNRDGQSSGRRRGRNAASAAGQGSDSATGGVPRQPTLMTEDRSVALFNFEKRLYVYRFAGGTARRLTDEPGEFPWLALSPKGRYASFVRDHDLYVIDTKTGSQRRLTRGGSENLLNAEFDWVYAEELYSHGSRAYWWSPDEKYIAYLQFDETKVPRYTVLDHFPRDKDEAYHPINERTPYPKAGDPNPTVRLGVVRADGGLFGGGTTWVDLSKYKGIDFLISRVGWSPRSTVVFQVQDREQAWLDANEAEPGSGKSNTWFRESSPSWVDITGEPRWLRTSGLETPSEKWGQSFLWLSQRDGYQHIYHYHHQLAGEKPTGPAAALVPFVRSAASTWLLARLTAGDWEVRDLLGMDEPGGWVYFAGTRDGEIETHAYRAKLDGNGSVQRLTEPGFSHNVSLDPKCRYFIDTYSNAVTPPRVKLCNAADGSLVRVISENQVKVLNEYAWGKVEYFRIPARDGYMMNAMLISPPEGVPPAALPVDGSATAAATATNPLPSGRGSDGGSAAGDAAATSASGKYPVWSYTYSGPHAPSVHNRWGGAATMNHFLAQRGYYVWICDNRSASGASAVSTWQCYERMGETELADLEDGLKWLIANRPVDAERIGLYGHSYGGFQTSYALTHSKMFKIGVAGAPVTDWRCYDSIYTERYMRTPANNPDGYERTAPAKAAANLHGKLLIMHGVMDDNVHMQNSAIFINNLQRANKQFEFMLYPSGRHGLSNPRHVTETRLNFILENL